MGRRLTRTCADSVPAMCNHYQNLPEALSTWVDYVGWSASVPDHASDVWPRRNALIVRTVAGAAVLDVMSWGIPLTLPGKRPGTQRTNHVTNVRNLQSPFWRATLASASQRCLVPFWRFAEPVAGKGREEAWFATADARPAAFAGVWRTGPAGPAFAFLTCAPNPLVSAIHPKAMPVILHADDYDAWLAGADAAALALPFPSQLMRVD